MYVITKVVEIKAGKYKAYIINGNRSYKFTYNKDAATRYQTLRGAKTACGVACKKFGEGWMIEEVEE